MCLQTYPRMRITIFISYLYQWHCLHFDFSSIFINFGSHFWRKISSLTFKLPQDSPVLTHLYCDQIYWEKKTSNWGYHLWGFLSFHLYCDQNSSQKKKNLFEDNTCGESFDFHIYLKIVLAVLATIPAVFNYF